ncbi:hypothetical protein H4696_007590 [Amycolatopsis lexingtonensis]|uniref:Uncharacterized protein n=1 Tax=Amycolatopsis lexingtonensis TaxID=218822 RepID=A0ABR9IBC7_9PSEU|nr:hypothetical protein [Amycolatopsis lexingtonensis]MBE1500490.1 hypothetical protein [Amycolatopsis lexingtonensis]
MTGFFDWVDRAIGEPPETIPDIKGSDEGPEPDGGTTVADPNPPDYPG